jgi:alpha-tubulin suppressor-like RCC1 family protein
MRTSGALLAAVLACAGCRSVPCRDGTVLLTLQLNGAAASASQLSLELSVDGQGMAAQTLPGGSGTIEIDFPSGYHAGSTLTVHVTALDATMRQVGAATTSLQLVRSCETLSLPIGDRTDGGCLVACPAGACGVIADECGGTLDCGSCSTGGDFAGVDSGDMGTVGFLADATSIAAGGYNVCAIFPGGALQCWGNNVNGQLGTGTVSPSAVPQPVIGLGAGVTQVAVGVTHICAIAGTGVKCWGEHSGFLIDPAVGSQNATTPVTVSGLNGITVTQLSASDSHTCALDNGGTVRCWGFNGVGQLGHANNATNANPVVVAGVTGATQVVASQGFSCALVGGGAVKCWGYGGDGELGNGGNGTTATPVDVSGLTGATAIVSQGASTCALVGGGVTCWGRNNAGQIGDGTNNNAPVPTPINGLTGVTQIAAGANHYCARTATEVRCWGANQFGQLGTADLNNTNVPVVANVPSTGVLVAGLISSYAFAAGSTGLVAWGGNQSGQLGRTGSATRGAPTDAPLIASDAVEVSPGFLTCSRSAAGVVHCYGVNASGELGNGTTQNSLTASTPTVPTPSKVSSDAHACALVGTKPYCWGPNGSGQLGINSTNAALTPTQIAGSNNFADVTVGGFHTCAIGTGGGVRCWGDNTYGQLGIGNNTSQVTSQQANNLSNTTAIALSVFSSCAIDANVVKCWGWNGFGGLGDGTNNNRNNPVTLVPTINDATGISVGYNHACAIVAAGKVKCWGYNRDGELGNGSNTDSATAVFVTGLTDVVKIVSGDEHTCALLTGGAVKCWGSNLFGQLGDGSYQSRNTPVDVTLPAVTQKLFAGRWETYALGVDNKWRVFGRSEPFSNTAD